MDLMDSEPGFSDAQFEGMLRLIQSPTQEPEPQHTQRKRSASPETDGPRRNPRRRVVLPRYIVTNDDSDSDSLEDAPLAAIQSNKNITNNPTITSDTNSLDDGISPISQANGNTTIEPLKASSPVPAADGPTIPARIKTAKEESDIDSKNELKHQPLAYQANIDSIDKLEREILAREAELRSRYAKITFIKADRVTREGQKMADVLAARLSDIKDRKDALTAALADVDTVSDENSLQELEDRTKELMKSTWEFETLMRGWEVKGLNDGKVERQTKVLDGEGEMKPMEENDGGDGRSHGKSVAGDDKDDDETSRNTVAKDDGYGDESEKRSGTKVDGDNEEDYEGDESDGNSLDGFIESDDYEDGDEDYREDSSDER